MTNPNDLPEHARKTIEDFKRDAGAKAAEARKALEGLNLVEGLYGLSLSTFADIGLGGGASDQQRADSSITAIVGGGPNTALRADQYLGLAPLDAAKRYIAQIGHAVTIEEISEAVSRGGAAVRGADWKTALERSLTRSNADVIKVQEGTFGLVKFYTDDQIRGLRSTRRQNPPPAKSKRKRGRPAGSKNKVRSKASASTGSTAPTGEHSERKLLAAPTGDGEGNGHALTH